MQIATTDERMQSLKTLTTVVYALYAATFFVGITCIVAIIINYVKKADVAGTWLESHFRWQIRSFWFGLLWGFLGVLTWIIVIGWVVLAVTCVCTGNSRRSILAATMVNVSAAYYGLPEIRGYSGGTKPSAFNERTVMALREIGIEVTQLDEEAARGDAATANPKHRIRWGSGPEDSSMRMVEFSKKYDDAANPSSGFAALIVCSDAEEDCPLIKGASTRIAMPYLDPKAYDGTKLEAQKYAERRDDIGRLMLAVMMRARLRLIAVGKFVTTADSK